MRDGPGGRLPTEAEWEYAARGGHERQAHAWGDGAHDAEHPQAHIYAGTFPVHPAEPVAVGSFPSNGYGLHDMAGNVWQWTADHYRPDTYARRAHEGSGARPDRSGDGTRPAHGGRADARDPRGFVPLQ
jgi:sulfatase modifying factor 1